MECPHNWLVETRWLFKSLTNSSHHSTKRHYQASQNKATIINEIYKCAEHFDTIKNLAFISIDLKMTNQKIKFKGKTPNG